MAIADLPIVQLPRPAKQVVFYAAFALLYLLYGLIVVVYYLGHGDLSEWVMEQVAAYIPVAEKEVSVPGALVPIVLGGLMAWTAPGRVAWLEFFAILALSAVAWLMYLHMQVFFGQPAVADMLSYGNIPAAKVPDTVTTLAGFANSVRSFVAVVFAATLGLRFNNDNGVVSAGATVAGLSPPPPPPAILTPAPDTDPVAGAVDVAVQPPAVAQVAPQTPVVQVPMPLGPDAVATPLADGSG